MRSKPLKKHNSVNVNPQMPQVPFPKKLEGRPRRFQRTRPNV